MNDEKIDATYYLNHAIIMAATEESNHSRSRDRHPRGRIGERSIASQAALTVHNPALVQQRHGANSGAGHCECHREDWEDQRPAQVGAMGAVHHGLWKRKPSVLPVGLVP